MSELDEYYAELILYSNRVVIVFSILVLIFGLSKWNKFNKALKIYWFFLLVSLGLLFLQDLFVWSVENNGDFWRPILSFCNISDTNFLRYPSHLNNFIMLGWFLYLMLLPRPIAIWVKRMSLLLVALVTINYFFIQGHNMAGGFNPTVSAFYCVGFPLFSMWYIYNNDSQVPLVHNPYFWINLGLIIPSLLALFLYFAGNELFNENYQLFAGLTIANKAIEVIAQILTAIGFYYARNVKYLNAP